MILRKKNPKKNPTAQAAALQLDFFLHFILKNFCVCFFLYIFVV